MSKLIEAILLLGVVGFSQAQNQPEGSIFPRVLKIQPAIAGVTEVVAESVEQGEAYRYLIYGWVVKPNQYFNNPMKNYMIIYLTLKNIKTYSI